VCTRAKDTHQKLIAREEERGNRRFKEARPHFQKKAETFYRKSQNTPIQTEAEGKNGGKFTQKKKREVSDIKFRGS